MTNFNELYTNNAGKQVTATDKAGIAKTFRVSALSEKMGTMKNGEKAAYVILTAEDGTSTVINLHPQAASALFKKGAEGNMTITADNRRDLPKEEPQVEIVHVAQDTTVNVAPAEPAKVEAAPADVAKEPSKKEKAIALIHAGWDAGTKRSEIVAKLRQELNMGIPGANTYFQNVRSGIWGGRKAPAAK